MCYNGFNLASERQTETITRLESGTWVKLPKPYSILCPSLEGMPLANQLVLARSARSLHRYQVRMRAGLLVIAIIVDTLAEEIISCRSQNAACLLAVDGHVGHQW